jgi:hypothetical protein
MAFEVSFQSNGDGETYHQTVGRLGQALFYVDLNPANERVLAIAQAKHRTTVGIFQVKDMEVIEGDMVTGPDTPTFVPRNFMGEIPAGYYTELTYHPKPDVTGRLVIRNLIEPGTLDLDPN